MQQIGAIQSLRAIAALMVVVHHLAHELGKLSGGGGMAASIAGALPWVAGVDIFFVISGFIMVHASASLFGRPGAALTFFLRRAIRIIPIYWLVTLLVAAIALVAPTAVTDGAPSPAALFASLAFWPLERPGGNIQPVLSLGWTLNYEMLFYVLFALALLAGRGARGTALIASGLLAALLAIAAVVPDLPWAFWGRAIIVEFALGMGVGLARAAGLRLSAPVRIALAVGAVLALALAPHAESQTGWQAVLAHGLPALALVAAAALGRDASATRQPGPLERLGDASYALYLTHPLALKGVALVFHAPMAPAALYAPVAIAAAVALAVAVWRHVERPVTAGLRSRFGV